MCSDSYIAKQQKEMAFHLPWNDIARYIAVVCEIPDDQLSEETLSDVLRAHIRDAPCSLAYNLLQSMTAGQGLACVILVVKLIMEIDLPPAELCGSVLKIFISDSGADLTNHLLEHRWGVEGTFGGRLAKIVNKWDKYQEICHHAAMKGLV